VLKQDTDVTCNSTESVNSSLYFGLYNVFYEQLTSEKLNCGRIAHYLYVTARNSGHRKISTKLNSSKLLISIVQYLCTVTSVRAGDS